MQGVEVNFVVKDSLQALSLYEKIFEIEVIESSQLPVGQNEVVFTLFDTRFHMLDENPDFQLMAPTSNNPNTIWFNVTVEDIESTYNKALQAGCTSLQEITELELYGISNAMVVDPFGYLWLLHEVHRVVSHEERIRLWQETMAENDAGG